MGQQCFAELARRRAQVSDVVVVNTHLYGIDVASGGAILPEHDVVVFDEAHGLEDIMSDTVGVRSRPVAVRRPRPRSCARILDDPDLVASIADLAELLGEAIGPLVGQRLPSPLPDERSRVPRRGPAAPRSDERDAAARSRPRSRTPSSASCGRRRCPAALIE